MAEFVAGSYVRVDGPYGYEYGTITQVGRGGITILWEDYGHLELVAPGNVEVINPDLCEHGVAHRQCDECNPMCSPTCPSCLARRA